MMRRPHWPRRQLCCALLLKDRSLHDLDSLLLCTIQPSTFMLAMLVLLMCTHLFLGQLFWLSAFVGGHGRASCGASASVGGACVACAMAFGSQVFVLQLPSRNRP